MFPKPKTTNPAETETLGLTGPTADQSSDNTAGVREKVGRALDSGDLLLAYQPVVMSRRTERIVFFEGLLRMSADNGRIVPAGEFLPACEDGDLGRKLDCLALERGLDALTRSPSLRLSINMSARSIGHPAWMAILERALIGKHDLGQRLILEITESSAIRMPNVTSVFMKDLQDRGICFALDDFGAGYGSFRQLKELRFDLIKIAGEFVSGIHGNAENRTLTQACVAIARQFDLYTVAEAVECREEADTLAECGVDCLQGYFYGMPSTRPNWPEFSPDLKAAC